MTTATTASSSPSLAPLLLLAAVLVVAWLIGAARRARAGRVCERHGHVPDPDTIGSWSERCRRCGGRIR